MNPQNEVKLQKKIVAAGEAALAATGYVPPIDALLATGWLNPRQLADWCGKVPYLERVVPASVPKISTAMRIFRRWAPTRSPTQRDDLPTHTSRRCRLHLSKSGRDPDIERAYRTH